MKRILVIVFAALSLAVSAQTNIYAPAVTKPSKGSHSGGWLSYQTGIDGLYCGLRLGPSFSTVSSDDETLNGGSSQTGLTLGVVLGVPLSQDVPVYLEPGLLYVEKGGKRLLYGKKMTYDLNYLELPIVVKYIHNFDDDLAIHPFFGGYFAYGVGGKIKNYGDRVAANSFSDDYFKRFDGGLRFGCGVSYSLLYADISYDWGLANINHDLFDKSHNGCFSISVGVNF